MHRDGTYNEGITLYTDRIECFQDTTLKCYMDTTDDFHVYRITKDHNDIMVYVDGILRIDGTNKVSNPTGNNIVLFGDTSPANNGRSQWDYIKFSIKGPIPPAMSWDHEYTADVLPDSYGWSLTEDAGGTLASVNNGILHLNTTPENAWWWYSWSWGASGPIGATFEARLKVISSGQDIIIWLRDGSNYEGLQFFSDRIRMFIDTSNEYFMDTTDGYHTYRYTIKENDYYVYVDGVLVIDGTNMHDSATGGNVCTFGDYSDAAGWTGDSEWDWVRFSTAGAFPPVNSTYDPYGNLTSTEISLPGGMSWDAITFNKNEPDSEHYILGTVLDGVTLQPVVGYEDLDITLLDISGIDPNNNPTIRLMAKFYGNGSNTATLHDWGVTWADVTPPATPTGLRINNPWTGYSLLLNWDANIESDLTSYVIYYSTDNVTFIWLANLTAGTLSYTHNGLSGGDTYYYMIAAADFVPNQSPFSEVISGIPDLDMDEDGIGNTVDPDIDGDTVLNGDDEFPMNVNEWIDTDGDGIGNNADDDDDDDGYLDIHDAFPLNDTESSDSDSDGIGDNTDPDTDGDGVLNVDDAFPTDPTEWIDTDSDGKGDNKDLDIDGDSIDNSIDAFPYNISEWEDTDRDSIGNNLDDDDDNDGFDDTVEASEGSNPDNPASKPADLDGDMIPDSSDPDIDGDGYDNPDDEFDYDPDEWLDTDLDATGDNADLDDDDDTFTDVMELNLGSDPLDDLSMPDDLDEDGIPDAVDGDDDDDGVPDSSDGFPLDDEE